jgi:hypothetical protein
MCVGYENLIVYRLGGLYKRKADVENCRTAQPDGSMDDGEIIIIHNVGVKYIYDLRLANHLLGA